MISLVVEIQRRGCADQFAGASALIVVRVAGDSGGTLLDLGQLSGLVVDTAIQTVADAITG
jgi:hypothetical protein